MTRPELAIDANGQPIQVPADAVGMRARRIGGGPGRPELACDAVGRPLLFPLDATFEDVYRAAGPGKYKMIFVDGSGYMLEDGPFGMTGMMQAQRNASTDGELDTAIAGAPGSSFQPRDFRDELLIHLITKQTQMAEAVIRGVPAWMEASAGLVNAAHNANLTTRPPVLLPPPDEEPEVVPEPEPPPPSRLPGWLREVAELGFKVLGEKVAGKVTGIPLEALFDWSKAAPKPPAAAAAPSPMAQAAAAAPPPAAPAPAMDPTWFHAASGGVPMDPAWFTPAPAGASPAVSAWPATGPVEHVPMDPVWFTPAPSVVMPPEAMWGAAERSSTPPVHGSQFPASPIGAPTDVAWYAATAPGVGTQSAPIASAPMPATVPSDPAWYSAIASELAAPIEGAPMPATSTREAPPSEAIAIGPGAATTPHGTPESSAATARIPMPSAPTLPSISTAVVPPERGTGHRRATFLPTSCAAASHDAERPQRERAHVDEQADRRCAGVAGPRCHGQGHTPACRWQRADAAAIGRRTARGLDIVCARTTRRHVPDAAAPDVRRR